METTDKELRFTEGFCNLLGRYVNGGSRGLKLHRVIEDFIDINNTPNSWVHYPIRLNISIDMWEDLILTMEEVIRCGNYRDTMIAKSMLSQIGVVNV